MHGVHEAPERYRVARLLMRLNSKIPEPINSLLLVLLLLFSTLVVCLKFSFISLDSILPNLGESDEPRVYSRPRLTAPEPLLVFDFPLYQPTPEDIPKISNTPLTVKEMLIKTDFDCSQGGQDYSCRLKVANGHSLLSIAGQELIYDGKTIFKSTLEDTVLNSVYGILSHNGEHYAYVVPHQDEGMNELLIDGKSILTSNQIRLAGITDNGNEYFYKNRDGILYKNNSQIIACGRTGQVLISADGHHYLCTKSIPGEFGSRSLIYDGKEIYQTVIDGQLPIMLSPNGEHYLFETYKKESNNPVRSVVMDGSLRQQDGILEQITNQGHYALSGWSGDLGNPRSVWVDAYEYPNLFGEVDVYINEDASHHLILTRSYNRENNKYISTWILDGKPAELPTFIPGVTGEVEINGNTLYVYRVIQN